MNRCMYPRPHAQPRSRRMYLLLLPHYIHIARPILTEGVLLMHERVHRTILTRRQYTITTGNMQRIRDGRDRPLNILRARCCGK